MKPCPKCNQSGSMTVSETFISKAIGTFSIAGNQLKTTGRFAARLSCGNCDFSVTGHLEDPVVDDNGMFTGGKFVQDKG